MLCLFALTVASAQANDTIVLTTDHMIVSSPADLSEAHQMRSMTGVSRHLARRNGAEGARRIDLKGMTLLPGLIDMHVHLTSDPRFSGYRYLEFTDNWGGGDLTTPKPLEAGFTTVRKYQFRYDDVAKQGHWEQGCYRGPHRASDLWRYSGHYGDAGFTNSVSSRNAADLDVRSKLTLPGTEASLRPDRQSNSPVPVVTSRRTLLAASNTI